MADILRVTEPKKMVTDPRVVSILEEQGKDVDYVEFYEDYSAKAPAIKTYRDLKTSEYFAIARGRRRVDTKGNRMSRSFVPTSTGWENKTNEFSSISVDSNTGETSVERNGKWEIWSPRIYLGGVVQPVLSPGVLLAKEGLDQEKSYNNVIEFDHGICKRRIILHYGELQEFFIFDSDPLDRVDIQPVFDKRELDKERVPPYIKGENGISFQMLVDGSNKSIPASSFAAASYPLEIDDSLNCYADGTQYSYRSMSSSWSTAWSYSGRGSEYSYCWAAAYYQALQYHIWRARFIVATAGLDDAAEISAATFHLNCITDGGRTSRVVSGHDFGSSGSTNLATSDIASGTGAKSVTFNATGLAVISKTADTVFMARNVVYDIANSSCGTGVAYWVQQWSGSGSANEYYLAITYTIPTTTSIEAVAGVAQANIEEVAGVASANIEAVAGVSNTS